MCAESSDSGCKILHVALRVLWRFYSKRSMRTDILSKMIQIACQTVGISVR